MKATPTRFGWILLLVSALAMPSGAHAAPRIAVVFATGGLGDKSFNDSAMEGLRQAQKEYGIQFDYAEPKSIAEYPVYLNQFANTRGYALIISIGFDQADALGQLVGRFGEQKFAIIDTTVDKPNVASYIYREQERGFLMGYAAALMTTRSGDDRINPERTVGVIGGMKIPLIDANIAGYIAGARLAEPGIKVLHAYVGHWTDPAKGKELTISLLEKGADIVWGPAGRSGLGVINAAKEKNHYAIGTDSDQGYLAPRHVLTNGMKHVNTTVHIAVGRVAQNRFQPGNHLLGVKEGALGYTRSILPQEVILRMEGIRQQILDGKIRIPSTLEGSK